MLKEKSISPSLPLNKSHSNAKRWRTATILGLWIALPCTLYFTACTHTVKWQQETLLNTGEMIVIDRKARFTYQQSGITNPLEYSLQPEKNRHIYFEYKGKSYHYYGELDMLLIAISPEGTPVLVSLSPKAWDNKDSNEYYPCAFYAKLTPNKSEKWKISSDIDEWIYGLGSNVGGDLRYDRLREINRIPWSATSFYYSRGQINNFRRSISPEYERKCLSRRKNLKEVK